jgi:hypothetical protein
MLHTPTLFDALQGFGASQPPIPDKITGRLLAYNRLPIEARTAIALRLVRGTAPVTDLTVAQACRLARVPRARVDRQLGRHRNVGDALVRAFGPPVGSTADNSRSLARHRAGLEPVVSGTVMRSPAAPRKWALTFLRAHEILTIGFQASAI